MTVYGPATGNYSAASIRLARGANNASAGDQIINGKFVDNTGGTDNYTKGRKRRTNSSGSKTYTGSGNGMIEDMYDEQTKSQLAQLKAAIQKGIAEQQTVIKNAPNTYQPLKNASEVTRYGDLRAALEQSANAGDRGGVGRMAALETQTEADNRLNTLNLQQQGVIDTANQNIADLNTSKSTSEAQIRADNAAAKLRAMIEADQAAAAAAAEQSRYEDSQALEYAKLQEAIRQNDIDNAMKQQELNYTTSKPYYKPSSGGSGGGGMTQTDAYNEEYLNVSNGLISPEDIKANKDALVRQYGPAKYGTLLKTAEENYSLRNVMMAQGFGTKWKGAWY